MAKSRITFHVLMENRNKAEVIKQELQDVDGGVFFILDTKESLKPSENDFDILILQPSAIRWEWLEALIEITREYSDLPVILYSPEPSTENGFFFVSKDLPIAVVNDLRILKQKLGDIIETRDKLRKRILFVDDDQSVLDSYTRTLRKTPWKIVTASSGERALEILQKEQMDLIVTDIKMPEIHGMELILRIRENYKELPIIICSGYDGMKDDPNLQFCDVADFLEKPVDPNVLKAKIKELL